MVRVALIGVVLLPLCLAFATGAAWLVTAVFLGHDLWLVVDWLLGLLFGIPLWLFALVRIAQRLNRPRIMENRRRLFE